MDLRQLEIFVTAYEKGSLSRAAECLNTSQPNVSKNIRALEEELGQTIHTSPLTQYNGALGAALFAYQRYQKEQKG